MLLNKTIDKVKSAPPLIFVSIFFILGIFTSSLLKIPFLILWFTCLGLLFLSFTLRNSKAGFFVAFTLFIICLGILHAKNYLSLCDNHIAFAYKENIKAIKVLGVVSSDPENGLRKTSFILKTEKLILKDKSINAQGKILVNIYKRENATIREFSYGDRLILEGNISVPFSFGALGRAPGGNFSYRDYLKNQGIYNTLNISKDDEVNVVGFGRGNFLISLSIKLRHKCNSIFRAYLTKDNAFVLSGIILGERYNFPEGIREAFIQTGTAHIIAISGFNVGIVTFISLFILKFLRIKRNLRYFLLIPILIIHCVAVGSSASILRATIMGILVIFSFLLSGEAHILNSLSIASLIILAFNPYQIFDVGFQLSFVSVVAIVSFSRWITRLFNISEKTGFLLRAIISGFSVSISAWLATLWFIAYYFRVISPVTVLANLVIVPYVSLVIILGYSLCFAGFVLPHFASMIAAVTNLSLVVLFKITHFFSQLPFAYFYF